jgi:Cu(I)/Ag(I) efflux system membrane fusion protein
MNRHLLILIFVSALLAGCEPSGSDVQETAREHALKHAEPGYVCPMHPQVTSDEPGSCPICGMDLVQRKTEGRADGSREVLYYRHPHKPEITSDVPATDEMGMEYTPVYAEGEQDGDGVLISAEVRNNLGVRVAEVDRGLLPRTVSAVGQVAYDESLVQHLHARAEGWVERLMVSSVGDRVSKDQLLLELYSPRLVTAQEEYLQALRMGGDNLIAASETRLRALGISDREISRVRETGAVDGRIHYRAPSDGVVTRLEVREGMYVKPDTDMIVLADLRRVWVEADVLGRQSEWLRKGVPAMVRLDQLPGRPLEGQVTYVYPEADPMTRAVRIRLAFENPKEVLKPNSFATVTISEPDPEPVLNIPLEALIRTSDQTRVIVEAAPNRFVPRPVRVAYESEGRAAVSGGLSAGERVVTSGQFMLDSEASLRGELERISAGDGPDQSAQDEDDPHAGHRH